MISSSVCQGAGSLYVEKIAKVLPRGAAGEWSVIRTAGKRELNGSAKRDRVKKCKQTKSLRKLKRLGKHKAQAVTMHATGSSTLLTNELNVNLANWEKHAAEWNAVKKECTSFKFIACACWHRKLMRKLQFLTSGSFRGVNLIQQNFQRQAREFFFQKVYFLNLYCRSF